MYVSKHHDMTIAAKVALNPNTTNHVSMHKCNTILNAYTLYRHLTHYQTTNFRLFQSERICRGQFQIWRKRKKVIQTGRKHCGKRRNCLLWAISPFPTVFSKLLIPRGIKRCHFVGMCWYSIALTQWFRVMKLLTFIWRYVNLDSFCGEGRARSPGTSVKSDLDLHS